jgi:hypothetical protein
MLIYGIHFLGDRPMKKLALVLVMLQTGFLLAAPDKPKDKPNPADFTVKVHVTSSGTSVICGGGGSLCASYQVLETVIDNQPVELKCWLSGNPSVLTLGDYSARLSSAVHGPSKNPNSYDIYRGYDLLLPDGAARTCTVSRLGPALSHP